MSYPYNARPSLLAVILGLVLAGCGSSGPSGTGRGGAGKPLAVVGSCLEGAGYGITVVPTAELGPGGSENRGPGQAGELLVGRHALKPMIGSDNADAVVAFWKSPGQAEGSPNAKATGLGMHADSLGSITVQPTAHLLQYVFRAARSATARRALYEAQVKKIEGCVG